jgi:hypothetical protein
MKTNEARNDRTLEIMLLIVTAGLAAVLYNTDSMKMVVLNLFYLPVVLAGFFLGRYRAGVLALLCVVFATVVIAQDLNGFANVNSPIVVGLAITLWGAVLGLTSILVGTLCDDKVTKAVEAHEAHVGVVEVLARYLQAANPHLESRAKKVADLCEQVARKMRLSSKEIDDIRVAALLMDIENIEITARVIRKAVGEMEVDGVDQKTFHGSDLVQSLGSVMSGAFPLLLNQTGTGAEAGRSEVPFGAKIIRVVRAYVDLADDPWETGDVSPQEIVDQLRCDSESDHHPAALHALEEVVGEKQPAHVAEKEPAAASAAH